MIRRCCVCNKTHIMGHWIHITETTPPDPEQVSHGYCDACFEELMQSMQHTLALQEQDRRNKR